MYLTNKDLGGGGYILKKVNPIFGVELGKEFLRLSEYVIDGRFKKLSEVERKLAVRILV